MEETLTKAVRLGLPSKAKKQKIIALLEKFDYDYEETDEYNISPILYAMPS
jgi:hypothetical protein